MLCFPHLRPLSRLNPSIQAMEPLGEQSYSYSNSFTELVVKYNFVIVTITHTHTQWKSQQQKWKKTTHPPHFFLPINAMHFSSEILKRFPVRWNRAFGNWGCERRQKMEPGKNRHTHTHTTRLVHSFPKISAVCSIVANISFNNFIAPPLSLYA